MYKIRTEQPNDRLRILEQAGYINKKNIVYSTANQSSNVEKQDHDKKHPGLEGFANAKKKQDGYSDHEKRDGGRVAKKRIN